MGRFRFSRHAELPRAAEHMPCFCEVEDGNDSFWEKPVKIINFSTGGWSGAESMIRLIERRFDMSHFMLSWRRGGHFVFEAPMRFLEYRSLPQALEARKGQDPARGLIAEGDDIAVRAADAPTPNPIGDNQ